MPQQIGYFLCGQQNHAEKKLLKSSYFFSLCYGQKDGQDHGGGGEGRHVFGRGLLTM